MGYTRPPAPEETARYPWTTGGSLIQKLPLTINKLHFDSRKIFRRSLCKTLIISSAAPFSNHSILIEIRNFADDPFFLFSVRGEGGSYSIFCQYLGFDTYYLGFGFAILKKKKYFCKDDEKRI